MKEVSELNLVEEAEVDNGSNEAGRSKLSFSAEQQTKVQELIDDAYRKAYSKASRNTGRAAELEKLEGEVARLREDKQRAVLYKSISKYNVVDAEEVAKLVGENIALDSSGSSIVVNDSGGLKTDSSGSAMSVDEYIGNWLQERQHHLRPSVATGAGSRGSGYRSGSVNANMSDPGAWRTMAREDLDRYLQEGVSIAGASGQVYKFHDVKNPFLEARKRKFKSSSN